MTRDLYIPTYTIKDWKLWEGDWELIKGTAVAMSPAPLIKHQLMGNNLLTYFNIALREDKISCGGHVLYEEDWIIDETNVVRPDILIACGTLDPDNQSVEVYELTDNKYKQVFPLFSFKLSETCFIEFDVKTALQV